MQLIDLATLLLLILIGELYLRAISSDMDFLARIARAFPMGAGSLALLMFLASWAGVPYTPVSLFAIATSVILILTASLIYRYTRHIGSSLRFNIRGLVGQIRRHLLLIIFGGGALILLGWLSVGRAYSTWDAIVIWGIKGIGFAERGTIMQPMGAYGLSYPINLPLQISFFRLLSGDLAPGSKLLFPLYHLSMILGTYAFFKMRYDWKSSVLVSLLLGTVPILVEHATIGYANLPFTVFLVLGLISIMQGVEREHTGEQVVGGIFLGFASWTRPEGAFLILPILVVIYLGLRWLRPGGSMRVLPWLLSPLLFIAIWQGFMAINGYQGFFGNVLMIALEGFQMGEFNLVALYWTARYAARQLIDPSVWGMIVPLALIVVALRWRNLLSRDNHGLIFFILPAFVGGLSLFGYYYLASFCQEIHYLLGTSVNRLFMPVWVLGFLGVVVSYAEEHGVDQEPSVKDQLSR